MIHSLAGINLFKGFSFENLLEAFLAGSNDGFLVLDSEHRVVTYNERYFNYHQTQYGINCRQGALLKELLPETNYLEIAAIVNKALAGEVVKFSLKFPNGRARAHWYDYEYHPLKNDLGQVIGVGIGVFETTERHETEEKLRQSEDLFKTIIQNSNDAFQLCNSDFELLFISSTIKSIIGFDADQLVGKSGLAMVHPDDREQVAAWFRRVLQHHEKPFSIEYRIKNIEGDWIWVENYGSNLLGNSNVNAVVMNLRNIQSKKIADFALIQAEQRLSLLLNNTDESFIILNSRLRIVAYNRAAQQHSPYFYRHELQSGISVLDLVEPDQVEAMINLFEHVFEGAQKERETTFVDEQGVEHIFSHIFRPLFDERNEINGVFITSADITKRKMAEKLVKESEERFKTIIQESFDAVLITDQDTNITYSSPSIANVLGYTTNELGGTALFSFFYPDDLQPGIAKFAEVMMSPNSEKNIDVRMRNRSGEYVWIELKAKNMFDNKYVTGVLVSLRDITSRKKAEEIISLSEQRFKGLVQSGADMIWILNDSSELQYASPTVQTIMGIHPENRYGHSIFSFLHPVDAEQFVKEFTRFVVSGSKRAQVGPYRYVNDDNEIFWIESTITNLLNDPSIQGIVLNSRDVTERKKLTEELAANTERLKTSQRIAKLAYFEYDFLKKQFFFSDEFYSVLGLPNTAMNNLSYYAVEKIIHPDDRERLKEHIGRALTDQREFNEEYRIVNTRGEEKVILAIGALVTSKTGQPEYFRITLQDITDSKIAIQALQAMESRFKSLFDHSIDGVVLSINDGAIISANPSVCRMLGYTETEMKSLKISDLFDFSSPAIRQMNTERAATGSFMGEVMIKPNAGNEIYAEVTSITIKDNNGGNIVSTIIRNITDKKKIEEEQKALTEELLRNNQDLQQFSFITSHNLRAPVANLISLLGLYDRQNTADEFNKVLIEKFEEATMQLNNTLNDLVNVLVIKSNNNIERQQINLSEIFENTRLNVENLLLEQGGSLEGDFSEVPEIHYNKIHINSFFLNFITNAIRYRSPERAPKIKVRSYRQDHWVVISFADNGLGIDIKRYGDRLFGLYQRFHMSKEGKGLGLYMTKSQITAMGGKIEVESEPGVGSNFKVFLKS